MYIIKNAMKNLCRSKGRNLLIGIIVFVIAVSACLGLSIHQASENAKEEAQKNLTITAQISVDRESMMKDMKDNSDEGSDFDKDSFKSNFQNMDSLTLDEMLTYADASTVQDFYYSMSVSIDGSDSFEPVTSSDDDDEESTDDSSTSDKSQNDKPDGMDMPDNAGNDGPGGFKKGTFGTQGDFTLVGYNSDEAMTDFISGTCSITDGSMFEEGTENYDCVISEELAVYNNIDLDTNNTITITNPNNEDETFTLTVSGIYSNSQSTVTDSGMMGGFSTSTDAANQIYLSYNALAAMVASSEANATVETDSETGAETTTALPGQLSGSYTFANVDDYETFCDEVYDLGLDDSYTVSSSDVNSYEQSIKPLENLNQMAMYFLIVVLAIGAVILIVLNIFSVRERKYEVGVLTAIGMKKFKVSLQFLFETLMITLIAIVLGGIAGGAASVSVTNSLLESQIESQENQANANNEAFGSEMGGSQGGPGSKNDSSDTKNSSDDSKDNGMMKNISNKASNYISEVDSAANLTVMLQLLGIGLGLTLIASAASIIFIMRYEPLKILTNRD